MRDTERDRMRESESKRMRDTELEIERVRYGKRDREWKIEERERGTEKQNYPSWIPTMLYFNFRISSPNRISIKFFRVRRDANKTVEKN